MKNMEQEKLHYKKTSHSEWNKKKLLNSTGYSWKKEGLLIQMV